MGKHRITFDKSTFCCPDKGKISITVSQSPRLTGHALTTPKWVEYQMPVIWFNSTTSWLVNSSSQSRPDLSGRLFKFSHFVAKDLMKGIYQYYSS
jgi:hypothetical protein